MAGARVALAHEWLSGRAGSEKTFEAMARVFPEADLYALSWDRAVPFDFGARSPSTTFLDRLPAGLRSLRALQLPLMPLAWGTASRSRYDVVVTSSHACVKGFRPGRAALHLCYCYTPARYLWLSSLDGRGVGRGAGRWAAAGPAAALRAWDRRAAAWVDDFAAISTAVRERVERCYGRAARVIHPPVDTDFFTPGEPGEPGWRRDFALAVSRMVGYKRLDLAIDACHRARVPLVVVGSGPEERALRAHAAGLGADVRFVVEPSDEELRALYRSARVLVFPAVDDFGIVAVEAQACGTPVVAVAEGGSLDTVEPGVTGTLVPAQDAALLARAVESVLASPPPADACRRNAARFSADRFAAEFGAWVTAEAAARGIALARAPVG